MEGRNLAKNFFTKSQERTFDSENHFEIKNSEKAHTKKSIISMISTLQSKRVAPATQNDFYTNNHNYKPKVENLPRNNFLPRQVKKPKNEAVKQNLAKYLNVDKRRSEIKKHEDPNTITEAMNHALYNPTTSRKRESSNNFDFRNDFKHESKKSKIEFHRQNGVIQSTAEPIAEPALPDLPVKSEKRGKKAILKRFLKDVGTFARESSSGSENGSNDLDVLSLKSDENIKFNDDDNGYVPGAGLKNTFNC